MIKVFFVILLTFSFSFAEDKTDLILQEIKSIKEDIKILREDMNKRFEQVDKRFEQVDKRLDFMQNLLYALMGLIFAFPFVVIYLRDKKEAEEKKIFDSVKGMLFVLREMAQNDEKLSKSLKAAGLL